MTDAILTQTKAEVLHAGNPHAKLTTAKGEVLHGGSPHAKVTTAKAEVLYSLVPISITVRRRIVVVTVPE